MKRLVLCIMMLAILTANAKPGGGGSHPSSSHSASPSRSSPVPSYKPAPTPNYIAPRRVYTPAPPPRVIVQQSGPSPLFWALLFTHRSNHVDNSTTVVIQCDTAADPYCNAPDSY